MKIIILEDLKGFRSTVEVIAFPLVYRIPNKPFISVVDKSYGVTPIVPLNDAIEFYPEGKPESVYGKEILLYKQLK